MRTFRELAGWGLLLLVQLTPLLALAMLVAFLDDPPSLALLAGAVLIALAWPRLLVSARRLREPPPDELAEADGRRPVVLLHRFARVAEPLAARFFLSPALLRELRDMRIERAIATRASRVGPVLPLARPAPPPEHGPVRPAYDPEWARSLDRHLRRAALAVSVVDGTEANALELERARAIVGLARTALVIPPHLPPARYESLRVRFPFLPELDRRARVIRFDESERAFSMTELLLRESESSPAATAPTATWFLALLAVASGVFSAIATPVLLDDRLSVEPPAWLGGAFVVIVLSIVIAALSRRAVRLVAANEAVMVTVAAAPWLLFAIGGAIDGSLRDALTLGTLGAAYSAPLLAATAVILAVSSLVRRASDRRPAFATFGAAALLPFAPLALSLDGVADGAGPFVLAIVAGAIGLGLATWAASGEPMRANAPLPIGAAVAAALAVAAGGVVVGHDTWRIALDQAQGSAAQIGAWSDQAIVLSTFSHAWPFFALAGPAVVVLVGSQFARRASRASIGNLVALAPLVVLTALAVSTENRARAALEDPNLAFGTELVALAEGTRLAPSFALPDGTYESTYAAGPAHVILDHDGMIAGGARIASRAELGVASPALTRALLAAGPGTSPLRVAMSRETPLAALLGLTHLARSTGWQSMQIFARNPYGQAVAVPLSLAGAPAPITVMLRPGEVVVTSATGAYITIPHVNGALDEAALRAQLNDRHVLSPEWTRATLVISDQPDAAALVVRAAAIIAAYFPEVQLGGI